MKLEILMNENKVHSLPEFVALENRYCNGKKPTVFVIQTGVGSAQEFLEEIKSADVQLADLDRGAKNWYYRGGLLETYIEPEKREQYVQLARQWMNRTGEKSFSFHFENGLWEQAYKEAMEQVIGEYRQLEQNENRLLNFLILLFFRIDSYFPSLFKNTKTLSKFPKFVYTGVCTLTEYFFLRLLSLCGCDVYCIHPHTALKFSWDKLSVYSQIVQKEQELTCKIPVYDMEAIRAERNRVKQNQTVSVPVQTGAGINLKRPGTENVVQTEKRSVPDRAQTTQVTQIEQGERRELSYEELAGLAGSIVMIVVFDEKKEPYASGSGVIINNEGYILTNFHVIQGAAAFGVRLEEEEELRFTNELIKYHVDNDLALIRIDPVDRKSIPVYQGPKLVRGQKVVAIGSPLGLFNTVSDGIIAGFRNFEDVSMIQFTAPTSPGSSGGALLNLYGELIGVVSGGYSDGENLNLAVDFETVRGFLRGFI